MLNPLIDDIFELILENKTWKIHTLASNLSQRGVIHTLDSDPQRDLFKRNFLIMNALFQLQQQLAPDQYLQIASLHIELQQSTDKNQLSKENPLRDFYLEWQNYDATTSDITALLDDFWQKIGAVNLRVKQLDALSRKSILHEWQLAETATLKAVQKRWRQLAFQHHPDKHPKDAEIFKHIREQYEQLKASYS